MVDVNVVQRRLVALEEYINDLLEVKNEINWDVFSTDKVIRRYVERTLHMAVEACLDITNHIISYEGYREPRDNKDSFEILKEQGMISEELSVQLKKMAQFRNVIVHDYLRIQPEIVYAILKKNVPDLIRFAKSIKSRFID
ncbi:MAG: DUF86 domain-containing protein [Firmicutes bacterium]|nr:DUF86 domain-containing protein [Bacillota bacterium]NSW89318.1 DUF86 domain-containing protein [Bacillota bacterium]